MNDISIDTQDVTQAVREAALLASVSIGVWEGHRTDAKLLDVIKAQHHATGDVGRVIKNVLAGADAPLKAVHSAFFAVRSMHYEMTLPWVNDPHAVRQRGPRLLPHLLFNDYMIKVSGLRKAAMVQLDSFLVEYPALVVKARQNLGGMADINYPTVDQVKAMFRIAFDFEPIPPGSAFQGLNDHMIERLSVRLMNKQARQVAEAVKAMWQQAREPLSHLAERLGVDAKGEPLTFKEATVDNVRSLITLLPGWNITGDPRVGELVGGIATMLNGIDAKTLRKDVQTRTYLATQAKILVDHLDSWGV